VKFYFKKVFAVVSGISGQFALLAIADRIGLVVYYLYLVVKQVVELDALDFHNITF